MQKGRTHFNEGPSDPISLLSNRCYRGLPYEPYDVVRVSNKMLDLYGWLLSSWGYHSI